MKTCCEGGPMTAGCHHDRCTGPREYVVELEEDGDDLILPIPNEILEALDWEIGDNLTIDETKDGFVLRKGCE